MKKFYLFLFLFFIFSCGEKREFKEGKREIKSEKIEKKIEEKNIENSDPLKEAMELLVKYKKNTDDEELKEKVCNAFKALAETSRERGNISIAEEYLKIASMCNGENNENPDFITEKLLKNAEKDEGLKVSLSNFDIQISGISRATQADRILLIMD